MNRKIAYWLSLPVRWFHRRGFGAHSPWAYEFVTEVLHSQYRYYIFDELDGSKSDEQLFRISNWLKVGDVVLHCSDNVTKAYLVAPIKKNELQRSDKTIHYYDRAHTDELKRDIDANAFTQHSCVIVDGILDENAVEWGRLTALGTVTTAFDTGRRGIVFFDPQRQKQTYFT